MKLKNGMVLDMAQVRAFTAEAGKRGITSEQLGWLLDTYGEVRQREYESQAAQVNQEYEQAYSQAEQALRAEWGATYDTQLEKARRGAREIAGDEASEFMAAVGNSPATIRALARLGGMQEKLNSATSAQYINRTGLTTADSNLATPSEASNAAHEIITNPNHPDHKAYHNHMHPNHASVVQSVSKLFQTAHPEPTAEPSAPQT
jgi:hypothetical protein